MKRISVIASAFMIGVICSSLLDAQSSRPASRPTTRHTTRPASQPAAEVSKEARVLLDRLDAVYRKAQPMKLIAHIEGNFDVAGRANHYTLEIDSLTDGKGCFIHRADPAGVVEQTGKELFLYDQKRNAYGYLKAPATRPAMEKLQPEVADILIDENPSLLLSLVTNPSQALLSAASKVGVEGPILVVTDNQSVRKYGFDDKGYISSVTIDFSPVFSKHQANGVKSAMVTITYESPAVIASINESSFDFKPPENSAQSDLVHDNPHPATTRITTKPASDN